MTASQAKAHLDPQTGEPSVGFVAAADVKLAIDQTYADMALIEPGTPQELDDLTDVAAPAPSAGQALVFNGSNWAPSTLPTSGGGGGPQAIYLDDFAGSTDQDKLNAALIYAATQTYRPAIQLAAKHYTFSGIHTFDGLRLVGAPGPASQADRAGTPGATATRISCTGTGAWLIPTADQVAGRVYDMSIQGIAFRGNSQLAWLADPTVSLWYCNFRDLTFSDFRTVLGTQANKLLITGCIFDGFWQINNSYDGAITLGGSDNALWTDGLLLDSAPGYVGSGQYHMRLQYLSKSTLGGGGIIYITCAGDWGGLEITGNLTDGPMFISGLVAEGRNASTPGTTGCIRHESGWTHLDNVWASFCQANPIQMAGGLMLLDRGAYRPPTTSPPAQWIHQTGGTLNIARCYAQNATKPVVNHGGGVIAADSTLTVV